MMKVLVIDDSRVARTIVCNMLEELGFQTVEAADGREALAVMDKNQDVEFALVDWNMPVMNGLDFVLALRQIDRWKETPLMMVTTETEMDQVIKALYSGANEYLMKPFSKDALAEKLAILGVF